MSNKWETPLGYYTCSFFLCILKSSSGINEVGDATFQLLFTSAHLKCSSKHIVCSSFQLCSVMNISTLQLLVSFSKPEATYDTIKGTFVEVMSFCVPV